VLSHHIWLKFNTIPLFRAERAYCTWPAHIRIAFCVLRIAFYVLRFAFCVFAFCVFAFCVLCFAFCVLRFTFYVLRFAFCVLRFAFCVLRNSNPGGYVGVLFIVRIGIGGRGIRKIGRLVLP
jgi:hypothetical protein